MGKGQRNREKRRQEARKPEFHREMSLDHSEDALLAGAELSNEDVNMIDEDALLGPLENRTTVPEPLETVEVETTVAATGADLATLKVTNTSADVPTVTAGTQVGEITCSNCQDLISEIRAYRDETRYQLRGLNITITNTNITARN